METSVNRSYVSLGIAVSLILLAVSLRVLPHPANFAPVAAVAIFGGAMLPRRFAVAVPLAAMMVSDLIIGLHDLIPITWGCYALIALASSLWMKKSSLARGLSLTLGGSVFFFVTTNLGVWWTSGMYAHTLEGFTRCFVLAIPFFRATLLSDLLYTGALFGLYALATGLVVSRAEADIRTL